MRLRRPLEFAILWWILFSATGFPKDLYGTVVVIDPGHGGQDPGSNGVFDGQRVYENEYTYDVSLRLQRLIRKERGIAVLTINDSTHGIRDWAPARVFPDNRSERFALNNSQVVARTTGMRQRLAFTNQIARRYPHHRLFFISIHFDVVGTRKDVAGVRIIAGRENCPLARALFDSFADAQRLRNENPLVQNGDRRYGIRHLYILNGSNQIPQKVLIELGNFNHPGDVWRIRNPEIREDYAQRIRKALTFVSTRRHSP